MRHPNEPTPYGIHLKWNIDSFLPFSSEFTNVEPLVECINPEYYLNDENLMPAFPLAAVLTPMRYALCKMGITHSTSLDAYDAEALQLEIDLCLLCEEIGKYNAVWMLLQEHLSYWEQYDDLLSDATNIANAKLFSKDLLQAAKQFDSEITHSFSLTNAENAFDMLSKEAKSLLNKNEPESAICFALRATKYFQTALSVTDNNDLIRMIAFLERLFRDEKYRGPQKIDQAAINELQSKLQHVANKISDHISGVKGQSATWKTDMRKAIDELNSWLFPSTKQKKDGLLNRYTGNGRGCVALLNIKSSGEDKAFFTISGFNDCTCLSLIKKLNITLPYLMQGINFDKICKMLSEAYGCEITYVAYTEKIAEHIEMYEVKEYLWRDTEPRPVLYPHYKDTINMSDKLSAKSYGDTNSDGESDFFLYNFSCCERKILAYLKAENIPADPPAAKWFIKYHPCIQCNHAIDLWRSEHGITEMTFLLSSLKAPKNR